VQKGAESPSWRLPHCAEVPVPSRSSHAPPNQTPKPTPPPTHPLTALSQRPQSRVYVTELPLLRVLPVALPPMPSSARIQGISATGNHVPTEGVSVSASPNSSIALARPASAPSSGKSRTILAQRSPPNAYLGSPTRLAQSPLSGPDPWLSSARKHAPSLFNRDRSRHS
jgi:hypothetical protein